MTFNSMASWRPASISISSWFLSARIIQTLLSLGSAVLNGALLLYLYKTWPDFNKEYFTGTICNLEIMICVAFAYSAFVLFYLHTGNRRRNPSRNLLMGFVIGDVIFIGLLLIALTMLGRTGLPINCQIDSSPESAYEEELKEYWKNYYENKEYESSVTPPISARHDEDNFPWGSQGSTTIATRFCGIEKTFYSLLFILIYTYIATIALGILRMCEQFYYTHNSEVGNMLARRDEYEMEQAQAKLKGVQESAPNSPVMVAGGPTTTRSNLERSPISPSSASQHQFHAQSSIPSSSSAASNNHLPYQQATRNLTNNHVNNNCPVSPVSTAGGVSPIVFPSPSSAAISHFSSSHPSSASHTNASSAIHPAPSSASSVSHYGAMMALGGSAHPNDNNYSFDPSANITDAKTDYYQRTQQRNIGTDYHPLMAASTPTMRNSKQSENENNPHLFTHPDGTTHNPDDDEELVNAAMVTDGGYIPGGMHHHHQQQNQQQLRGPSQVAMMMMRDRCSSPAGTSVVSGGTFLPPYTPRNPNQQQNNNEGQQLDRSASMMRRYEGQ